MTLVKVKRDGPRGWHFISREKYDTDPKAYVVVGGDPLDHDGDGKAGGSKPAEQRGLDDLMKQADELGAKVDKRWGEDRLRAEIDKKLAE
jgi:hypothetical protein